MMTAQEREQVKADDKLTKLASRLRSRLELDEMLDADPILANDPELKAGVVNKILALIPRLRAN
jgi:hypothetical protein